MTEPLDLAILTYHHVGTPHAKARYRGLYVTPACLKAQVQGLKQNGYRFLRLADLTPETKGKVAVITFDDGYRDNLTLGLPVLQDLAVPATLFMVTGAAGAKQHSFSEAGDQSPHDFLTWDELKTLQSAGWEIGSHGDQHIHFGRRDETTQLLELETSSQKIAAYLGAAPISFAFPFGSFNPESFAALQRSSYRFAVTTEQGNNHSLAQPFALKRIPLKGYRFWHRWSYHRVLRQN
jgi:peptidoglycan/xylan/chitin deacetylase (PgdA/CDA1 family)